MAIPPKGGPGSLVHLDLEGDESLRRTRDVGRRPDSLYLGVREFQDDGRLQSGACRLEMGDALLEGGARGASLARAPVVSLMCYICGGDQLDEQQQRRARGGQPPPNARSYAQALSKNAHQRLRRKVCEQYISTLGPRQPPWRMGLPEMTRMRGEDHGNAPPLPGVARLN